MTTAFDTLTYAKQLKQSGVPEEQAEIHAQALQAVLKEHIAARFDQLDQRFDHAGADLGNLKTAVAQINSRLDATLPTLATKAELETVRTEIHSMGMKIIMWNVATMLATAGMVFAILRFL